jgi:hypothetical protein
LGDENLSNRWKIIVPKVVAADMASPKAMQASADLGKYNLRFAFPFENGSSRNIKTHMAIHFKIETQIE